MPELRGPRRLHGGQKSEPGARVKAEAAEGGGASAPALRRATGSDMIKASKSTLTRKTVAHTTPSAALLRSARLRSFGSSSAFLRRMDFGVTSTSSSSWM